MFITNLEIMDVESILDKPKIHDIIAVAEGDYDSHLEKYLTYLNGFYESTRPVQEVLQDIKNLFINSLTVAGKGDEIYIPGHIHSRIRAAFISGGATNERREEMAV